MPWLDRKEDWLKRPGSPRKPKGGKPPEKSYSVSEVAEMLSVSRQTVFKWLSSDNGAPVIPAEAWYKLPHSGQIRILEWILTKLQGGG